MPSTPGTIDIDDDIDLVNFLKPEYGIKATYIACTAQVREDLPPKVSALSKFSNRKNVLVPYQDDIEIDAKNLMEDDDRKLWLSSKRNSKFP